MTGDTGSDKVRAVVEAAAQNAVERYDPASRRRWRTLAIVAGVVLLVSLLCGGAWVIWRLDQLPPGPPPAGWTWVDEDGRTQSCVRTGGRDTEPMYACTVLPPADTVRGAVYTARGGP